jgi:hypothetical protein
MILRVSLPQPLNGSEKWFPTGIITSYIQTVWTLIYMRVTVIQKDEPIMIEANA